MLSTTKCPDDLRDTLDMLTKLLSVALAAWCAVGAAYSLPPESSSVQRPFTNIREDVKVPVVLGVMSQCPDAILCESVFDRVLQRVGDKVDLSLTFVGRQACALL